MVDRTPGDRQPRWPRGTPVRPDGHGPGGGRFRGDADVPGAGGDWASQLSDRIGSRGRRADFADGEGQASDVARFARQRRGEDPPIRVYMRRHAEGISMVPGGDTPVDVYASEHRADEAVPALGGGGTVRLYGRPRGRSRGELLAEMPGDWAIRWEVSGGDSEEMIDEGLSGPDPEDPGELTPARKVAAALSGGHGLQAPLNGEWQDLASAERVGSSYRVTWENGTTTSLSGPDSAIRVRRSNRPIPVVAAPEPDDDGYGPTTTATGGGLVHSFLRHRPDRSVLVKLFDEDWTRVHASLTSDNPDTPGTVYFYGEHPDGQRYLFATIDTARQYEVRFSLEPDRPAVPEPESDVAEWASGGRVDARELSSRFGAGEQIQIRNTVGEWDTIERMSWDASRQAYATELENDDERMYLQTPREIRVQAPAAQEPAGQSMQALDLHRVITPGTPTRVRLPDGTEVEINATTWSPAQGNAVTLHAVGGGVFVLQQHEQVEVLSGLPAPGMDPVVAGILGDGDDGLDALSDESLHRQAGDWVVNRPYQRWETPTPEQRAQVIADMRALGAVSIARRGQLTSEQRARLEQRQVELDDSLTDSPAPGRAEYNEEIIDAVRILLAGPPLHMRGVLTADYRVDQLGDEWDDQDAPDIINDWRVEYEGALSRGEQARADEAIDMLAEYTGLGAVFRDTLTRRQSSGAVSHGFPGVAAMAPRPAPPAGFPTFNQDEMPLGATNVGDLIRQLHERDHRATAPVTAKLERRLRAMWTFSDPSSGLHAEVTRVSPQWGGAYIISGKVYDEHGSSVGTWERVLEWRDESGTVGPHIHHDYFRMHGEQQGGGFTSRWFEHVLKAYKDEGIEHVSVHANIDVGGYTWTHWFDFESPRRAREFLEMMRSSAGLRSGTTQATMDEIDQLLARIARGEHVSAREVGRVGYAQRMTGDPDVDADRDRGFILRHRPDGSVMEMWFGKQFLLGMSWAGIMHL